MKLFVYIVVFLFIISSHVYVFEYGKTLAIKEYKQSDCHREYSRGFFDGVDGKPLSKPEHVLGGKEYFVLYYFVPDDDYEIEVFGFACNSGGNGGYGIYDDNFKEEP